MTTHGALWVFFFFQFLLTGSFCLASSSTHIGLGFGLVQDQRTTSSKDALQNTVIDGYLFTPLFKTKSFFLGAEYLLINSSMPNGADDQKATLSSTNPMIAVKLHLDKRALFAISLMGSPVVQATYSVSGGVANDLWTGIGYAAKLTLQPEISSSWKLPVSLIYYSASYSSKSSTSTSTVSSFNRTMIIPTIGLEVYF